MTKSYLKPKFLLKKKVGSPISPDVSDADNSLGWLNSHVQRKTAKVDKPPKKTKLNPSAHMTSWQINLNPAVNPSESLTSPPAFTKKLARRLSVSQKITLIFNELSSLPFTWSLKATVGDASPLHEIENKAYNGEYRSAKKLVRAITALIAREREFIYADTTFASERLLSFRAIKRKILKIQNLLHSFSDIPDTSALKPPQVVLNELDLNTLRYSIDNKYMFLRIGDDKVLHKSNIEELSQATFNALHSPIFNLVKFHYPNGYIWTPGVQPPLVRIYVSSNRGRLYNAGKDEQSLCLLEVKLGETPHNVSLVIKPFGTCHEILDEGKFTLDSPVAWIWAAVLGIESTPTRKLTGIKFHVPNSFLKNTTVVAKVTYQHISDWFMKKDSLRSPASVAI